MTMLRYLPRRQRLEAEQVQHAKRIQAIRIPGQTRPRHKRRATWIHFEFESRTEAKAHVARLLGLKVPPSAIRHSWWSRHFDLSSKFTQHMRYEDLGIASSRKLSV